MVDQLKQSKRVIPGMRIQHPLGVSVGLYLVSDHFKGLKPNSQNAYRGDLNTLRDFFDTKADGPISAEDLAEFMEHQLNEGLAERSLSRLRAVVNRWLAGDDKVELRIPHVRSFTHPGLLPPHLAEDKVEELLKVAKRNIRDQAIFTLGVNVPALSKEILALNRSDLEGSEDGTIGINSPLDKVRRWQIGLPAAEVLWEYLGVLPYTGDNSPLFINHWRRTRDHDRLGRGGYWELVKKYRELIGQPDLTPTMLHQTAVIRSMKQSTTGMVGQR